jgi:hypothetical protein
MKNKIILCGFVTALVLAIIASPVVAQSSFNLNVNRNIGYSSGSQIRGSFRMTVIGPTNEIKSVTFLIDGQTVKMITNSPFTINFETTDYPSGWHDLSASIVTTEGQTVTTPTRRFDFVSAEEESAAIKNIILPLVGGILAIIIIIVGSQFLFSGKKSLSQIPLGAERSYGISGGAICPKCHRPFPLPVFSMNIGIGTKLARCIFCGKWSFVRRARQDELRRAEAAELADARPETSINEKTEAEKLKEMLDESRFTDKP